MEESPATSSVISPPLTAKAPATIRPRAEYAISTSENSVATDGKLKDVSTK